MSAANDLSGRASPRPVPPTKRLPRSTSAFHSSTLIRPESPAPVAVAPGLATAALARPPVPALGSVDLGQVDVFPTIHGNCDWGDNGRDAGRRDSLDPLGQPAAPAVQVVPQSHRQQSVKRDAEPLGVGPALHVEGLRQSDVQSHGGGAVLFQYQDGTTFAPFPLKRLPRSTSPFHLLRSGQAQGRPRGPARPAATTAPARPHAQAHRDGASARQTEPYLQCGYAVRPARPSVDRTPATAVPSSPSGARQAGELVSSDKGRSPLGRPAPLKCRRAGQPDSVRTLQGVKGPAARSAASRFGSVARRAAEPLTPLRYRGAAPSVTWYTLSSVDSTPAGAVHP